MSFIQDLVQQQLQTQLPGAELIALALTGSHAYGMATKDSDRDVVGICLPPPEYLLGVKRFDQLVFKNTEHQIEGTIFSFQKWFHLLTQQNPNILETLWHEDTNYIMRTPHFDKVYAQRDQLLSKKTKHTYGGYAYAQLQRLTKLNANANQNESRIESIRKYGYDIKAASHVFRLLGSALDILVEHEVQVLRPDNQFLIAIREGTYSLEDLRNMSHTKMDLIDRAYVASDLRNKIDQKFADTLQFEILKEYLEEKWQNQN